MAKSFNIAPLDGITNSDLTDDVLIEFKNSILEFLGFEKEVDGAEIVYLFEDGDVDKKIKLQPSPRKECIQNKNRNEKKGVKFMTIKDIQHLWNKIKNTHKSANKSESTSPLMDFARNLHSLLPTFSATSPITPSWIFSPFEQPLQQVINTVITSQPRRLIRISLTTIKI